VSGGVLVAAGVLAGRRLALIVHSHPTLNVLQFSCPAAAREYVRILQRVFWVVYTRGDTARHMEPAGEDTGSYKFDALGTTHTTTQTRAHHTQ
jgi:hypothetical protein